MAVSDGQRANQQTFNDAFVSRTQNSDTIGVLGLNHPSSGGLIPNAQQQINDNKDTSFQNSNDIAALQSGKQDISEKNQVNGYAGLDGSGKLSVGVLPDQVATLEGNWNANTNTPSLADGVGNLGEFYIVSVAGTQDLGSGSQTFEVGDWVLYNSSNEWVRILNSSVGVPTNLGDLADVDVPGPAAGQILRYSGTAWVNSTVVTRSKSIAQKSDAAQSIPNNTSTKVTFNANPLNEGGNYDTGNSKYICPRGGVYIVNAGLIYGGTAAGATFRVEVRVNGSLRFSQWVTSNASIAGNWNPTISAVVDILDPLDEIEIYAFQNSGGAVDVLNIPENTYFSVVETE